jgi:hypothetical protein
MNRRIVKYDSVPALVRDVETYDASKSRYNTPRTRNGKFGLEFTGVETWGDALALAKTGCAFIGKDVGKLSDSLRRSVLADIESKGIRFAFDYTGDVPDAGRYAAGEGECMIDTIIRPRKRADRVVTLVVNLCAPSNVKTADMIERGAAVCSLVDLVEGAGVRVEVYAACAITSRQADDMQISVCVKRAQDSLNLDEVGFALAHPTMFRRLILARLDHLPATARTKYGSGYGMPADFDCDAHGLPCDIGLLGSFRALNGKGEEWVRNELDNLGLLVNDEKKAV